LSGGNLQWKSPDNYASFLSLDALLKLQQPQWAGMHDEVMFVAVLQASELRFKPILHELTYLRGLIRADDLSGAPDALAAHGSRSAWRATNCMAGAMPAGSERRSRAIIKRWRTSSHEARIEPKHAQNENVLTQGRRVSCKVRENASASRGRPA
jgi:hypothetical protein